MIINKVMAAKSITDRNGKKVPYSVTTNYLVDYGDGTAEGSFILNPTQAQIQVDYNSKHPVVVVPPVITPPVIIPPKGAVRNITANDFQKLNGSSGENLKVVKGTLNDQYQPTDCNNTVVDLSDVIFSTKGMPAIEMKGHNNGLTFLNPTFQDCDNSCISYQFQDKYTGKDGSFIKGLIINGAKVINSGYRKADTNCCYRSQY